MNLFKCKCLHFLFTFGVNVYIITLSYSFHTCGHMLIRGRGFNLVRNAHGCTTIAVGIDEETDT